MRTYPKIKAHDFQPRQSFLAVKVEISAMFGAVSVEVTRKVGRLVTSNTPVFEYFRYTPTATSLKRLMKVLEDYNRPEVEVSTFGINLSYKLL